MWQMVRRLRESGVTIILTTHYIEEAEEMADRVGVISQGKIILVEDKAALMQKLGKKELRLQLQHPLAGIPEGLKGYSLSLAGEGSELIYTFDAKNEHTGIAELLRALSEHGIDFKDLRSSESSLEDIFVNLVKSDGEGRP
jgi:ABC-2 type transport system ATP-binding protein